MPQLPVPTDPWEPAQGHGEAGFGDILFSPHVPEPEYEVTPEQQQDMLFRADTQSGPPVAGRSWEEARISQSEVCVFGGWPRRHLQIGRHCPHGMLELLEESDAPEDGARD